MLSWNIKDLDEQMRQRVKPPKTLGCILLGTKCLYKIPQWSQIFQSGLWPAPADMKSAEKLSHMAKTKQNKTKQNKTKQNKKQKCC